ncbi:apolipoprotein N-acyltransferase [Tepidiphilus baoligensis]|uniref:Apolipoprotein N-acyltransferase n=1 Tax=Tepidiphilus baoligensis TaxID=2698687 RepID=A0ABX1QL63_9PROT|nr:apolipoprotein N-acyltransferase [Tepidiphilus baoligensis]NMH16021.1 apolipoprotein N-acyltransferase [Tepidiphilus baoligensis]
MSVTAWLPRLILRGRALPSWAVACLIAAAGASAPWAFAPTEVFWWLPVALLPLLFALKQANPRQAMVAALLWAWPYFFVGVGWLSVALARYGGLPWPAAWAAVALFAVYLAAWWALAAGLAVRWSPAGSAFRRAVFTAAVFTATEWARGWVFTGFPWLSPGLSQTPPSPLAGFYPLVGSLGVGFLLFVMVALLAFGMPWRRWLPVVLLVAALGGVLRSVEWTRPVGAPLAVSLIQPAIPQDQKWDGALLGRHLWRQAELIAQTRGTLVVLPETSLPLLDVQIPDEWHGLVAQTLGEDRTVLYGTFTRDEAGVIHNSAVAQGKAAPFSYHKRHLVPFGEYSPPLFGWFFRALSIPMSNQGPGEPLQPFLHVGETAAAVDICYESAFADLIAGDVRAGATWLLNLSNLAWYDRSAAQAQHAQIGRVRALETARPWVQATNTGVSGGFDVDGRVLAVLPEWRESILELTVQGRRGETPFVRFYGEMGTMALLVLLTVALRGRNLLGSRR